VNKNIPEKLVLREMVADYNAMQKLKKKSGHKCLKDTVTAKLATSCLLQEISSEEKGNCAIQTEYFPKESNYCCLPD
jgi:hypothetical protein